MSEVVDWHKRATAVSNALYAEGDRRRLGAYSGFMYGVDSALTWASEREPTDAEVEAACRAFYEATNSHLDPSMQLSWDRLIASDPDVAENYRCAVMPALLAAQKVRAGQ